MRFELLLMAVVVGARGGFISPELKKELEALIRNDFAAYAAMHGMRLTYHEAVTSDGWILQLWRIRSPNIHDANLSTPIILSHGFGSSSFDYMRDHRNQSTAFVLADNGYDVWLTNYRATQFSNRILSFGKRMLPKPTEYYRAAWQYMAELDLPAVINKVLTETRQSKFYMIGHSMGATIAFAYLSRVHSHDNQLLHFAAVVPVLKFGRDASPAIGAVLKDAPKIDRLLSEQSFGELFGRQLLASTGDRKSALASFTVSTFCTFAADFCELLLNLLFDRNVEVAINTDPHLNKTRNPVYSSKTPGGVTMMNVYNYGQQWGKDQWTKIDFRSLIQSGLTNQREYQSVSPPEYNFGALRVPFSLFFVDNDVFTGPETARKVIAELRATDYHFIAGMNLSHLDAVVGIDTRCYTINEMMLKFERLEINRSSYHERYRRRVRAFVNSLPFEDGCPKLTRRRSNR